MSERLNGNGRIQTVKSALDDLSSTDPKRARAIRNILKGGYPKTLGLTGLDKREKQNALRVDLNGDSGVVIETPEDDNQVSEDDQSEDDQVEAVYAVRDDVLELIELKGANAFENEEIIDRIMREGIMDPAYFESVYREDPDADEDDDADSPTENATTTEPAKVVDL